MSKKEKEEKKAEEAKAEADKAGEGASRPLEKEENSSKCGGETPPPQETPAPQEKESPAPQAREESKSEAKAEPDWKSLYAITLADFDNYKKRAARDREDVYRYAESDILKDILPTVDNLALALASAKAEVSQSGTSGEDAASPLKKGVQMVYEGLLKALADHGAKPMEDLVGKELDPNFHEAIATLPDEKIEEGKISNVAKVGWLLNDKLLRAAQVVVSAGKPA